MYQLSDIHSSSHAVVEDCGTPVQKTRRSTIYIKMNTINTVDTDGWFTCVDLEIERGSVRWLKKTGYT